MSIDEKLAEYRARKAREYAGTKDASQVLNTFTTLPVARPQSTLLDTATNALHQIGKLIFIIITYFLNFLRYITVSIVSFISNYSHDALLLFYQTRPGRLTHDLVIKPLQDSRLGCTLFSSSLVVKLVAWTLGWAAFIYAEFGAVYFTLSLLFFIYFNTRTSRENDTGPSAYSVFNAGCERLDGTFTAEQFEKELRYGPSSVH